MGPAHDRGRIGKQPGEYSELAWRELLHGIAPTAPKHGA